MNTIIILASLALLPALALAAEPSATTHAGKIEYRSAEGKMTIFATKGISKSPSLSPDTRTVAYIHVLQPQTPDRDGEAELWIGDGVTGRTYLLMSPHPSPDPKSNLQWFDQPIFSVDGKSIYINAMAWGDEGAMHQVDVATGKERFIIDGSIDSVMRTGPYRGDLVVARHTCRPPPAVGCYYPLYIVGHAGNILFRVPDMESDGDRFHFVNWLNANSWTAW